MSKCFAVHASIMQSWIWQKRHLKSEVALLQTLSPLFHLVHFVKCWQFFLELNSKRLYLSSVKVRGSRCHVFTSSEKREIRQFHIVVAHWLELTAKKCTKKRDSRAKLLFCQSKPITFLPFPLTPTLSLLKLTIKGTVSRLSSFFLFYFQLFVMHYGT